MGPLLAAGLISAGSQAANGVTQMLQNRANRRFAEKQTNQARQWALEDWQSQNEYNSPRAQMQRLQEAGLNPNLVYGTGAATQAVQPIKSTEQKSYQGQAPNFDFSQSLFTGVDLAAKKAQVDLLEVQKTVAINNAALLAQKSASEVINQAKSKFSLENAQKLQAGSLQLQQLNLQKLEQDIDLDQKRMVLSLSANDRQNMLAANSLQEAAQRIAESKSRIRLNQFEGEKKQSETRKTDEIIKLMGKDQELRELDLKLKREGLQPSDPTWQRVLMQQLKKYLPDLF